MRDPQHRTVYSVRVVGVELSTTTFTLLLSWSEARRRCRPSRHADPESPGASSSQLAPGRGQSSESIRAYTRERANGCDSPIGHSYRELHAPGGSCAARQADAISAFAEGSTNPVPTSGAPSALTTATTAGRWGRRPGGRPEWSGSFSPKSRAITRAATHSFTREAPRISARIASGRLTTRSVQGEAGSWRLEGRASDRGVPELPWVRAVPCEFRN